MKTFLLTIVLTAIAQSQPNPPATPASSPVPPPTIESLQAELVLVRAQLNQLDLEFGQLVKTCNDPGLIVAKAITIQSSQRLEELRKKTTEVKAAQSAQSKPAEEKDK